ncbi:MAG: hypothetical protein WDW38_008083 [Sanguina aurantia]
MLGSAALSEASQKPSDQGVVLHSAAAANPGGVPSLVLPEAQESTEMTLSSSAAMVPAATTKDGVTGAMLEPSVLNKQWVRALAILAAVGLVSGSSIWMPSRIVAFLHVTSYALMLGTSVWNTFFVGLTMFKNMPRQMFGRVQSKLFPMYFGLTCACNALMIGTLLFAQGLAVTQPVVSLGYALAASLANWFWLEPKVTALMFDRYDLENKGEGKTEADKVKIGELYTDFGKWHGVSVMVNLLILCCVIAHGWTLSAGMTVGLAMA